MVVFLFSLTKSKKINTDTQWKKATSRGSNAANARTLVPFVVDCFARLPLPQQFDRYTQFNAWNDEWISVNIDRNGEKKNIYRPLGDSFSGAFSMVSAAYWIIKVKFRFPSTHTFLQSLSIACICPLPYKMFSRCSGFWSFFNFLLGNVQFFWNWFRQTQCFWCLSLCFELFGFYFSFVLDLFRSFSFVFFGSFLVLVRLFLR